MAHPLKLLVLASLTNLLGNGLGALLAMRHNLVADFGGFLHGHDVRRDFLTYKGTALSAPLPLLLLQLGLTGLALGPGRSGTIGQGGLTAVGAFYTFAQLGEPIVWRQLRPGGYNRSQAGVLAVNVGSAIAMLVFGLRARRTQR